MSAQREVNFALSNALDQHLRTATDLSRALLMMACSELFSGDEDERSTVNTLAGMILDHHKGIDAAWTAWVDAGALRDGTGEGGRS